MAESGDNGANLSTRARIWFGRLSRVKKVLATSAALVITVGGVASATTSVLDLGTRLGGGSSGKVSAVQTPVQGTTRVREGVRVTEVIPGSPADRAGVEVQDVVTNINGEAIEDVDAFADALKHARPGETLLLSVVRDSQRKTMPVKLDPIDDTDLVLGTRTEDIEPDQVVTVLPLCPSCLFRQGTTPKGPETTTTSGSQATDTGPPTSSPEANPSTGQYAP
jgi:PDZ domain